MAHRSVKIELPQEIYQHFQDRAQLADHSVSQHISDVLVQISRHSESLGRTIRSKGLTGNGKTTLAAVSHFAEARHSRVSENLLEDLPPELQDPLEALAVLDTPALQKVMSDTFPLPSVTAWKSSLISLSESLSQTKNPRRENSYCRATIAYCFSVQRQRCCSRHAATMFLRDGE